MHTTVVESSATCPERVPEPLPPREPEPTPDPSYALGLDDPRHFELLQSAVLLVQEGRYDFAVISLQTALEIYLELEVARLLEWRRLGSLGMAIYDTLVRNYTFTDGRLQALWYALTGDDIATIKKTQDWWNGYPRHVDLRHSIVHRGHRATEAEARQSVKTAIGAMHYIQTTTHRVGVDLGRIWETGTARPKWQELPPHDRLA